MSTQEARRRARAAYEARGRRPARQTTAVAVALYPDELERLDARRLPEESRAGALRRLAGVLATRVG